MIEETERRGWYKDRAQRLFLCNNAKYSIKQVSSSNAGILTVIPSALILLPSRPFEAGT